MALLNEMANLDKYETPPVKLPSAEEICIGYGKAVPVYCVKYGCGFSQGWCFKAGQVKLKPKKTEENPFIGKGRRFSIDDSAIK